MKTLLIGSITKDIIEQKYNNIKKQQPGGKSFYGGLALAKNNYDTTIVSKLNSKDSHLFESLKQYKNLKTIFYDSEKTTFFRNIYADKNQSIRISTSENDDFVFNVEKLPNIENYDAVFLGAQNDFEIPLETLIHLYKSKNCIVSADLEFFLTENFDPYILRYLDIIQVSENDSKFFKKYFGSKYKIADNKKILKYLASQGVKISIITFGEQGSLIYDSINKSFHEIKSKKIDNISDTTGAGDIFNAAFLVKYTETKKIDVSGKYASKIASERVADKNWI